MKKIIMMAILVQSSFSMSLDSLRSMRDECAQEIAEAIKSYESNQHGQELDAQLNKWDIVKNNNVLLGTLAINPVESDPTKSALTIKNIVGKCLSAIRNNNNDGLSFDFARRVTEHLGSDYAFTVLEMEPTINVIRKTGVSGKVVFQDETSGQLIDQNIYVGDKTFCVKNQCQKYMTPDDPTADGLDPFLKIFVPTDRKAYKKLCPQDELGSRRCNISDDALDKKLKSMIQVFYVDHFFFKYPQGFRYYDEMAYDRIVVPGLNDKHKYKAIIRW